MVDGPARLRPTIAEAAALGDEAAVRGLFARLRSRRVVGKCVVRAAADPDPAVVAAAADAADAFPFPANPVPVVLAAAATAAETAPVLADTAPPEPGREPPSASPGPGAG